jgi:hypothetical protein
MESSAAVRNSIRPAALIRGRRDHGLVGWPIILLSLASWALVIALGLAI